METIDTRVVFVDHAVDTPDPVNDNFLSDITAGSRAGTTGDITTKTIAKGVYDLSDIVLSGGTSRATTSINIYYHTGVETTSVLILFIDSATGLPLAQVGGDVTITWDNGANKVYNWLAS